MKMGPQNFSTTVIISDHMMLVAIILHALLWCLRDTTMADYFPLLVAVMSKPAISMGLWVVHSKGTVYVQGGESMVMYRALETIGALHMMLIRNLEACSMREKRYFSLIQGFRVDESTSRSGGATLD